VLGLAADLSKRRATEALSRAGRSFRLSAGGLLRGRYAPGRRLPLLGPPGHGGVGARVIPAARRTG
jgi:hypothetical protein